MFNGLNMTIHHYSMGLLVGTVVNCVLTKQVQFNFNKAWLMRPFIFHIPTLIGDTIKQWCEEMETFFAIKHHFFIEKIFENIFYWIPTNFHDIFLRLYINQNRSPQSLLPQQDIIVTHSSRRVTGDLKVACFEEPKLTCYICSNKTHFLTAIWNKYFSPNAERINNL